MSRLFFENLIEREVIEMLAIIVYDIPAKNPESLSPLSINLKKQLILFKALAIEEKNIKCCFSLEEMFLPDKKVQMVITIEQSSLLSDDRHIKTSIAQTISNVIKTQFPEQIHDGVCSQFIGWPDVLGQTQNEKFV